jgi:uncharacterized membrane protein YkvA (DUF1232 family)
MGLVATPAPHPLAGLASTLGRLPRYLVLARSLIGDRRLSRWRKAALGGGIAYLASPIDLVPGILPVIGQLDDLAAVLLALRFALKGLSGPAGEAQLTAAGLSPAAIDEDLANVRRAAGWVARRAAVLGAAAARRGATVGVATIRRGASLTARGARMAARVGRGMARRAGRPRDR